MKITDKRTLAQHSPLGQLHPDDDPPSGALPSVATPVPLLIAGATETQVVRPGDSLLLVFQHALTPQRMQALQWNFAQHHPDMNVIVIDGAEVTVIRSSEPQED